MTSFENSHFQKTKYSQEQINNFIRSAERDLGIAADSKTPEVTFKFSYDALIKIGIALIAQRGYKVRSAPGHHIKIIDKLSEMLKDETIGIIANKMRQDRNLDLYHGGHTISQKDSREYLVFIKNVFKKAKALLKEDR